MKIGGGGWVVGVSINPAEKGLMYARTDVSGAYRWVAETRSWKQVVTSTSLPAAEVGYGKYCGVDSIVGAPTFMSAWSLDWCAHDPKFLVSVFRNHLNFGEFPNSSGYSTDGGLTWTRFAAVEKGTLPAELDYGVVAVAANNPDHIVWCPTGGKLPYFTTDRGATWKQSDFGGPYKIGHHSLPSPTKPLAADRVEPDTFYFYTPQDGMFRSTDGGATFKKTGNPVENRWNCILKSTPGRAGDLWFASGAGTGLYHSTDGGATWTQAAGINIADNVGIGKAKPGSDYPTLYVAGVVAGNAGIYRSTDQAQTWDKIVDYPLGIFDAIDGLDGDKDIFGQVYVGFTSAGFAYGKPKVKTE